MKGKMASSFSNLIEQMRILLYRFCITYSIKRKIHLYKVKRKQHIEVVFFAANLSMWRYQHLYELMSQNNRFKVHIILSPFLTYSEDEQKKAINELKAYFDSHKIRYLETDSCNVASDIDPDILFYPQYYFDVYKQEIDAKRFRNRLLCAYPYSFNNIYDSWAYNDYFHNAAWKLFYPTQSTLNEAKKIAYNKGRNIVITGYPNADEFLSSQLNDVWKSQTKRKKKIVWAPHFTIEQNCSPLFFSTFLEFSTFMQQIAKKYSEDIQIAFKPHPRLLSELYIHRDWGKIKADEYYKWWGEQDNTQIETGNFIDLFKTSDALIHDSGSFSIEYFYTKKPALYLCRNLEEIKKEKNEVGKAALDVHYIGKTEHEIINFIDNVILKNDDPMKEQREAFFNKYLLPPNEKSVAQNTLDNILKSLDIE